MDLLQSCIKTLEILSLYYQFSSIPNMKDFLITPHGKKDGQILLQEEHENVFIAITFSNKILSSFSTQQSLSPHTVAVVAEEVSHFKFLSDIIENKLQTTHLIIETIGEIDRFLCLMHWNHINPHHRLNCQWKNIHNICDHVFTGNRFQGEDIKLYIDAENLAFKHLKEAFWDKWNCSHFNFEEVYKPAQEYLYQLRTKLLS